MKVGNKNSITGIINIVFTNFKFSKNSGLLENGEARMNVEGTTSGGLSFGFTGALVYECNHTGSLTINGKKFYINIQTGTIQ
ncbi:MAG: hypothetical protein EOM90_07530 [Alphaproteobacteria bacterium]|nr:hypothetical protein [Alphaproteobacteria bacterium]